MNELEKRIEELGNNLEFVKKSDKKKIILKNEIIKEFIKFKSKKDSDS